MLSGININSVKIGENSAIKVAEFSKEYLRMPQVTPCLDRAYLQPKQRGFVVVDDAYRKFPYDEIQSPARADFGSCAYDMYCPTVIVIEPNEQILIWTDVKAYMLLDEVLVANVRSSMGKIRIQLANTIGWVDSTYYSNKGNDGNIGLFLRNEGTEQFIINTGDRIAQVMFQKYLIADDDNVLHGERIGGFGSSNRLN